MATKRQACGVCVGSGWVDPMHLNPPGPHLGPHNSMPCGACGGRGYTEHWVPDPPKRTPTSGGGRETGTTPGGSAAAGSSEWLPGVDAWFDRNLPWAKQGWVALLCAMGAMVASTVYLSEAGLGKEEALVLIGAATVGGMFLVPLVIFAIKLLMTGVVLALLAGAFWVAYVLIFE